ncbi:MAG TPA: hypothetical protein VEF04_21735, partial [Blastocatellia bacterium]|nr:hypothetical protein [Blastocatellia bacterium]
MANDPHNAVRRTLIKNPNIKPDHLIKMGEDKGFYDSLSTDEKGRIDKAAEDKKYGFEVPAKFKRLTPHDLMASVNLMSHDDRLALTKHPHADVRHAMAIHGDDEVRDLLLNDPNSKVRQALALKGNEKHHDHLVNDKDQNVLAAVAQAGRIRHLDKLVNHHSTMIRGEVAKRGFSKHLETLANDEDDYVRATAHKAAMESGHEYIQHQIEDSETTPFLKDQIGRHLRSHFVAKMNSGEELSDREFAQLRKFTPDITSRAVSSGILHPKHLVDLAKDSKTDEETQKHLVKSEHPDVLDHLTGSQFPSVRSLVASRGSDSHLDKLVHDPDVEVRAAVARRGGQQHLDQLIRYLNPTIHRAMLDNKNVKKEHLDRILKAAKNSDDQFSAFEIFNHLLVHGHEDHADELIDHESAMVRQLVARHGSKAHQDKLLKDEDQNVRAEVAKSGTHDHRDKLVKDPSALVRQNVALHGNQKHWNALATDPEAKVRKA